MDFSSYNVRFVWVNNSKFTFLPHCSRRQLSFFDSLYTSERRQPHSLEKMTSSSRVKRKRVRRLWVLATASELVLTFLPWPRMLTPVRAASINAADSGCVDTWGMEDKNLTNDQCFCRTDWDWSCCGGSPLFEKLIWNLAPCPPSRQLCPFTELILNCTPPRYPVVYELV